MQFHLKMMRHLLYVTFPTLYLFENSRVCYLCCSCIVLDTTFLVKCVKYTHSIILIFSSICPFPPQMAVAFKKPVTRWVTVLVSGALVTGWLYSRRKKRKINETSTKPGNYFQLGYESMRYCSWFDRGKIVA